MTAAVAKPRLITWLLFGIVVPVAAAVVATLSRQPILALGAVVAIAVAAASFRCVDVPTYVVLFLIYTNAAVVAVKFHGVPFLIGAGVPLLLSFPLAYYTWFRKESLVFGRAFPLIIAFLLIQIVGVSLARHPDVASANLVTFTLEGIVLYVLVTNVVRTPRTLQAATWTLLAAGCVMAAVPLYQQVTGTFDNKYGGFGQTNERGFRTGIRTPEGEFRQLRLTGPIGEQNFYAQVMLVLVPLGVFQLLGATTVWRRCAAAICTSFAVIGTALSFSRSAAVAFGLLLMTMAMLGYFRFRHLAIAFLAIVMLTVCLPHYVSRLGSLESLTALAMGETEFSARADLSFRGRATEMLAALLVFVDHPVIGVGPGMFEYYAEDYGRLAGLRSYDERRQAHSLLLAVAAEHGLLGLSCFVAILFVTLQDLVRACRRCEGVQPDLAHLATGYLMAIVAYLLMGLFLHFAYIRYFWLLMALAASAGRVGMSDPAARQELDRH